jgi:hypothetical protein
MRGPVDDFRAGAQAELEFCAACLGLRVRHYWGGIAGTVKYVDRYC